MSDVICASCGFTNPQGFRFCGECGTALTADTPAPRLDTPVAQAVAPAGLQRYQLTIMFCDMVSSTHFAQALDPEDFRQLIRRYQQAAEPAIRQHGGFVSRFLGDGILAIFGYPRASEGDAIRAATAGLDIVERVRETDWRSVLGSGAEPQVRIGIATGSVLAGDLISADAAAREAVVGETPDLAMALQSLAAPDTVVVGARTQRLLAPHFSLEAAGSHVVKRINHPLAVWRVRSPRQRSLRDTLRSTVDILPLVNRVDELQLLDERWALAKDGRTQLVLLSGEAGIGKSRVVQAFQDRLTFDDHYFLRFQCSPYHSSTALYPVAESLARATRIHRSDSALMQREKLRTVLRVATHETRRFLPALAALLDIPPEADDSFQALGANARKRAIIDALFAQITGLAGQRAVCAVIEDIHWSDPTTLELLERLAREQRDVRLMMVVTERAEQPGRQERYPVSQAARLHLKRLPPGHTGELVRQAAAHTPLPDKTVQQIVAKADGVALFAEELARSLVSSTGRSATEQNGQSAPTGTSIPETLHDLLMARLDELNAGKRIAQIASVIGRQFSHALLHHAARHDGAAMDAGLTQLLEAGLVHVDTDHEARTYQFKHALIRDAAYGSLLRHEHRQLHRVIADALAQRTDPVTPELLARHYTEAEDIQNAIRFWLAAGQAAAQRSAYLEASEQLTNGLKQVRRLPEGNDRDRKLLKFLVHLGPTQIATCGAGSPEAEACYREAVALSEQLPGSEDHFSALWGWWRISKNFATKAYRASRLQTLAESLDEEGYRLQAHHCQWATCFHLADHEASVAHADQGMGLYANDDYRSHAARFGGHDPRVCALGNLAQSQWLTGRIDTAVQTMAAARAWAEELDQAGSIVHVMDMNLLLLRYRNEAALAATQAHELNRYATEHHFSEYLTKAKVFLGWAVAGLGESARGIALMKEGIREHDAIGTREDPPVFFEMLAHRLGEAGDHQAGLETLERALTHTENSGLRFWQAELWRRRGELLLQGASRVDAQAALEEALSISEAQGAHTLSLRALSSLVSMQATEPAAWRARLAQMLDALEKNDSAADIIHARKVSLDHG